MIPDQHTFTTLLLACNRDSLPLTTTDGPNSGSSINNHPSLQTTHQQLLLQYENNPVNYIVHLMEEHHIEFDAIIYGAMIDAYRRHNQSQQALTTLYSMMQQGIEPAPIHVNMVLLALRATVSV
jgi:pentatricopeptide repeat protein